MRYRWLVVLFSLLYCHIATAEFLTGHEAGWHWYEDPPVQVKEKTHSKKKQVKVKSNAKSTSAEARLEKLQSIAKHRLSVAVIEPTPKNVQSYIVVQNLITQMAGKFSKNWQQALWQAPKLDYRLKAPVNQMAGQIHRQTQLSERENKLKALSKKYGLFFIFQSTCPYCHRFAPTVAQFSDRYGFEVVSISLDDKGLPGFEKPKSAGTLPKQLEIQAVPAIYAVSPNSQKVIPISFGLISLDELERRMETLL